MKALIWTVHEHSKLRTSPILILHFQARSQNCETRLLASSCLSVSPPARMEELGSHWTDFYNIWFLSVFRKHLSRKFKFHSNLTRITDILRGDEYTFLIISRSLLLRMKNVWNKKLERSPKNTHFIFNDFFFRKSCRLWDNVEKYCTAGQATDDNIAHALCMLDT